MIASVSWQGDTDSDLFANPLFPIRRRIDLYAALDLHEHFRIDNEHRRCSDFAVFVLLLEHWTGAISESWCIISDPTPWLHDYMEPNLP